MIQYYILYYLIYLSIINSIKNDISSPSYLNKGIIITGVLDGNIYVFDVWTGELKWSYKTEKPFVISSVFVSNRNNKANNNKVNNNNKKKNVNNNNNNNFKDVYDINELNNNKKNKKVIEINNDIRYIPGYDGNIYKLSKSGIIENMDINVLDIVHSHIPISLPSDTIPNKKLNNKFFLLGQKDTEIYKLDIQTGQINNMYSFSTDQICNKEKKQQNINKKNSYNHDNIKKQDKSTIKEHKIYLGRSNYNVKSYHMSEGSFAWELSISELFIYSQTHEKCEMSVPKCSNIYKNNNDHLDLYPDVFFNTTVSDGKNSKTSKSSTITSQISSFHPITKKLLWSFHIPGTIMSTHGVILDTGVLFHEKKITNLYKSHKTIDKEKFSMSSRNTEIISLSLDRSKMNNRLLPAPVKAEKNTPIDDKSITINMYNLEYLKILTSKVCWPLVAVKKNIQISTNNENGKRRRRITKEGMFITWKQLLILAGFIIVCVITLTAFLINRRKLLNRVKVVKTQNISHILVKQPSMVEFGRSSSNRFFQGQKKLNFSRSFSLTDIRPKKAASAGFSPSYLFFKSDNDKKLNGLDNNQELNDVILSKYQRMNSNSIKEVEEDSSLEGNKISNNNANIDVQSKIIENTQETVGSNGNANNIPFVSSSRYLNEFEELKVLGKGGFGIVILARNKLDGRNYAIKRIGLNIANQSEKIVRKFLREVKILALLDHPNIVRYYQAWLENAKEDDHFIEMSSTGNSESNIEDTTFTLEESNCNKSSEKLETSFDDSKMSFCPAIKSNNVLLSYCNNGNGMSIEKLNDDGFIWEDCESTKTPSNSVDCTESNKNSKSSKPSTHFSGRKKTATIDHRLFIQMQYCPQKSLSDFLESNNRIVHIPQIIRIIMQITSALVHVHSCGLIHRDLKPSNILVMDEICETIKLGDFGLSRYNNNNNSSNIGSSYITLAEGEQSDLSLTEEKTAGVGTFLYASPEQNEDRTYDSSTDIYSVGMIFFELCHIRFNTSMERIKVLQNARKGLFSDSYKASLAEYDYQVDILNMLYRLLDENPLNRPTAKDVYDWCCGNIDNRRVLRSSESLSMVSSGHSMSPPNSGNSISSNTQIRIQIEAKGEGNDLLINFSQLIRRASDKILIVQCGVRPANVLENTTTNSQQLLEFLLQDTSKASIDEDDTDLSPQLKIVLNKIQEMDDVGCIIDSVEKK